MRAIPLACLLVLLCGGVAATQRSRDDGKPGRTFAYNENANLIYSLADAPLTSKESDQIYRLIDTFNNQDVHNSFTDEQRAEEREAVMSSRVGWIKLAEQGSPQLAVQGPASLCCGTGGCRYWIFIRRHGQLQLILEAFGYISMRKTSSQGFLDVVMASPVGMLKAHYAVYRWNGTKYKEVDYYCTETDPDNPDKPPVVAVTDCAPEPR
jgi:putative component of toxin-antitoxin plasmid stabilization module